MAMFYHVLVYDLVYDACPVSQRQMQVDYAFAPAHHSCTILPTHAFDCILQS